MVRPQTTTNVAHVLTIPDKQILKAETGHGVYKHMNKYSTSHVFKSSPYILHNQINIYIKKKTPAIIVVDYRLRYFGMTFSFNTYLRDKDHKFLDYPLQEGIF